MIYRVTARYVEDRTPEFYARLSEGSIERQKPDGREIVSSMRRAKIIEPGVIQWYETCYCPTPLEHEKRTVYARYLEAIETEAVEAHRDVAGESFWSYLQRQACERSG